MVQLITARQPELSVGDEQSWRHLELLSPSQCPHVSQSPVMSGRHEPTSGGGRGSIT